MFHFVSYTQHICIFSAVKKHVIRDDMRLILSMPMKKGNKPSFPQTVHRWAAFKKRPGLFHP